MTKIILNQKQLQSLRLGNGIELTQDMIVESFCDSCKNRKIKVKPPLNKALFRTVYDVSSGFPGILTWTEFKTLQAQNDVRGENYDKKI